MPQNELEILLVEDDPQDLDLTMHALHAEHSATRIAVARDGEEALEFLLRRGECPRLIVLDLKLPRVEGLEVLRQIRKAPRTRLVPVVILTSSRQESDMLRAYELGANSYIQKPVAFDRFRETIKQVVSYWLLVNQTLPGDALIPERRLVP